MFVHFSKVDIQHPILIAAKRAGITQHLIRAWEKRYDAVSPDRTDTNRRLYSEDEIERLRLLGVLTKLGHRIGDIARQPTPALMHLAATDGSGTKSAADVTTESFTEKNLKEALDAIHRMDTDALEEILNRNVVALGQRGILEKLISPLTRRIGDMWIDGSLSAAHEHFASNILRMFLLNGPRAYAEGTNAPVMIVTTPVGQLHELGAAMVAAYARDLGWRVLYLGASLPAADIAHAAKVNRALAVILSIVHPTDDAALPGELKLLHKLLSKKTTLIVGGESAFAYAPLLDEPGIIVTNDLDEFSLHLARLRRNPRPAPALNQIQADDDE
jgi:MerR family transcriptional regulator, light-induced transcriptional regulator